MYGIVLGFKIQTFKILPFGFAISFKVDTKNYNIKILKANLLSVKKTIVALAGPLVNLAIIAFFFLINQEKIFYMQKDMIIYSNFLIFTFNMLPIYPLDGGRVLKNIIYILFGKTASLKIVNLTSNLSTIALSILAVYISVLLKNISYLIVIMYLWIIVFEENRVFHMKIKMYEILENNIALNKK